jgi:hypothetical protein
VLAAHSFRPDAKRRRAPRLRLNRLTQLHDEEEGGE